MNSIHHAKSAARKWGGGWEEYVEIEEFIDSSKKTIGDVRHRAMYHHTEGVWLCQRIFGRVIKVGERGIEVPVRLIAERHIIEDLGWLPSPADYLKNAPIEMWMSGSQRRQVDMANLLKMAGREDGQGGDDVRRLT